MTTTTKMGQEARGLRGHVFAFDCFEFQSIEIFAFPNRLFLHIPEMVKSALISVLYEDR
jgi:hypothetical protein